MAVTSFIRKGSYAQLFAKMLISGFFLVLLVRCSPFNSEKLDLLPNPHPSPHPHPNP